MTWEDARAEFLRRKAAGEDPLIVRCGIGPAPSDARDFDVVDRWTEITPAVAG